MRNGRLNAVAAVDREPRPLFQVLIVYDDFISGRRANDTCSFLMSQLGDEVELRSGMWKFEILRNPKLAEIAAAEALEADAIIVATHGVMPLPVEVTGWVDRWLPLRGDRTAALIALMDGRTRPDEAAPPAYNYLQQVATAANMDFLPQLRPPNRAEANVPLPPAINPALMDESVQRPFPERHWGINE